MPVLSFANRRALLGWLLVASAVVALSALGRDAGAADAADQRSPIYQQGAQVYAAECSQCHGADAAGGPVLGYEGEAPSLLAEDNPDVDVAYLDLVMSTGRMPPAGSPWDNRERAIQVDEEDQAALIAFMVEEFGTPGEIPQVDVEAGDPASGQAVWTSNCAHCHGSTGAGGVAGAGAWTPQVTGQEPEVIAEAIRVGPFNMPRFDESQLTDQEVNDVVAFMDETATEEGTPVFGLVELNPVYASAFVFLFAVAMLASLIWIGGRPARLADPDPTEQAEVPSGATRRAPRTAE
jgi:ubiquinol-cytochrome c reductase cytochrome c subunit